MSTSAGKKEQGVPRKEQSAPKVGSITHALAILRHLSSADAPEGVTSIARALGISPSSCFNILKTLAAEEYVDFNPKTKAYTLGWAPVILARRALDPAGVLPLLIPEMEDLADRYSVACGLGRVTRNDRIILIGYSQSETATSIQLRIGHRTPLLAGASGRIVAAASNFSPAEIQRGFNDLRWQNPPSMEEYLGQVDFAREHGWALDASQSFRGVTTLAAPVMDGAVVRYVVQCAMFNGQYSNDMLTKIGGDLAALTDRASARLFGRGELPSPARPKAAARKARNGAAKEQAAASVS